MSIQLVSPKKPTVLLGMFVLFALLLSACAKAPDKDVPQPSNPGPAGSAVKLTGNPTAGADVFSKNCVACHGEQGKKGIANPGSSDGTIPTLNPIDDLLVSSDLTVYSTNLDLYIEHGSTPEGNTPALKMTAFGDQKILTPQQIADVIAYVISLNKK